MNKYSVIVLITLGIIGVALFAYFRDSNNVQREQAITPRGAVEIPPGESVVVQPLQAPNAILYTESGYTPNLLRIKVGTVVTFINSSSVKMWPASAMHPTHNVYPTTGGCLGSTFDACRGIPSGETWDFMFDIPGVWQYHDHLAPKNYGTIIVE
jgi:plastocyanin